jgi:hypothetical protein
MLPLLRPAALSDPASHRLSPPLVHGNTQCREICLGVTLPPKYIQRGVGGRREFIIQPPQITKFCSKLDLLFGHCLVLSAANWIYYWTLSGAFCRSASTNLTEPLPAVTRDLHPAVQFHTDRTSPDITRHSAVQP